MSLLLEAVIHFHGVAVLYALLEKLLRLALVGGFLTLVIGVSAYFAFDAHVRNELAAAIAETDKLDARWRPDEMEADRAKVPNSENSALRIIKVAAALKGWKGDDLDDFYLFRNQSPSARLNEQQATFLGKIIEPVRDAIELALPIRDMPRGRYPGTFYGGYPELPGKEQLVCRRLLSFHTRAIAETDRNAAMQAVRAQINVSRSIGDHPTLIALMMRNLGNYLTTVDLERVLAQGEVDEKELIATQRLLELECSDLSWVRFVRGERALAYHRAHQPHEIHADDFSVPPTSKLSPWLKKLPQWHVREMTVDIRSFNRFLAESNVPLHKLMERRNKLPKQLNSQDTFEIGLNDIALMECAALARFRCTSAALACERYRLTRNRWPAKWEELVEAKCMDSVPLDPFNNEPLRLRYDKGVMTVYSLGSDLKDNQGKVVDAAMTGNPEGMDIGFRLWDVAARRGPPPPPIELPRRAPPKS